MAMSKFILNEISCARMPPPPQHCHIFSDQDTEVLKLKFPRGLWAMVDSAA